MDLETCWYEVSPYMYIAGGTASIFYAEAPMARLPGLLLIAAAATIIRLRWRHRRAEVAKIPRAHDVDQGKADLPGVSHRRR
ncbi:hypothetical protein [Noviherbaspirillum pedocola]|uniref:Uncharacterized protein n=1 Tax=Noviherbaspirillum pedocola TaxID=2801341 RepID=A0A934SZX7_9BURK|nr:hypothetical protein [Noviherbaspirillum pedocola]MBK4736142.1 hypothetical protein [Noviherbaspirillum pedocola]